MDFDGVVRVLNELLSRKQPETFSSSWILKYAPSCYRFIQEKIRTDVGEIDWDRVTRSLTFMHQRKWKPVRTRNPNPHPGDAEAELVLKRYRERLYVFLAAPNVEDRQLRDVISVALARLAQKGNRRANHELMKLLAYTIDEWLENDACLCRWRGHEDELRRQVDGCIRRYRYSGSFLRYLYRTLEYAGRGLQPLHAYSLDESVFDGARRRADLIAPEPRA